MTFLQTLRLVVLPQAFTNIVPPLASVTIALLKNTSIASAFFVFEGIQSMNQLINDFGADTLAILAAVAVIYLVLALAVSAAFAGLERVLTADRATAR
jgi:glutamate transport system permease protein